MAVLDGYAAKHFFPLVDEEGSNFVCLLAVADILARNFAWPHALTAARIVWPARVFVITSSARGVVGVVNA